MICCWLALSFLATWVFGWRNLKKKLGLYEEPALDEEYLTETDDCAQIQAGMPDK